jgi:hypothetical protein
MISFKRRSFLDQLRRWLSPRYRRESDARLKAAISALVNDPSLPCEIEGVVIPNGYGR